VIPCSLAQVVIERHESPAMNRATMLRIAAASSGMIVAGRRRSRRAGISRSRSASPSRVRGGMELVGWLVVRAEPGRPSLDLVRPPTRLQRGPLRISSRTTTTRTATLRTSRLETPPSLTGVRMQPQHPSRLDLIAQPVDSIPAVHSKPPTTNARRQRSDPAREREEEPGSAPARQREQEEVISAHGMRCK
jgi:hypothetical protein